MLVSCLQGHLMQRWHQLLVDKVDNSGKLRRQMEKHGALSPAHAAEVLGLGRRGGRQEGGKGGNGGPSALAAFSRDARCVLVGQQRGVLAVVDRASCQLLDVARVSPFCLLRPLAVGSWTSPRCACFGPGPPASSWTSPECACFGPARPALCFMTCRCCLRGRHCQPAMLLWCCCVLAAQFAQRPLP